MKPPVFCKQFPFNQRGYRNLIGYLPCFVLSLGIEQAAFADTPAAIEDVSITDLMQMQVSSVSRKTQSLSNTAAAAYIISQEDIRRSGATSIPEALRLAPGLEVAQIDANSWAITARGFNGRYANKLLVLMDGRTLYTPLFAGVFWNLQDTLMEDIERIEVIRGPGAVMWGANAVNGVINIITKKAKDTQGDLFVAGGGNQEQGFAGFRHGGQLDNDGSYRVYGKAFERAANIGADGQRAHDDWRSAQGGFRYDQRISNDHRFTVQGDVYRKSVGRTTYPLTVAPPFNVLNFGDDKADGANLLARWEGNLDDGSEFMLQSYYDRVSFNSPILSDTQDMFDVDFQHRLHPNPDHDLMWGASYRYIHNAATNTNGIAYTESDFGYHNGSVFLQDEINLIDNVLKLTLGSKLEESHFGNTQVQPNIRMLWTPNSYHSVWASASRASRNPTQGESQANIALGTVPTGAPPPFDQAQVRAFPTADLKAEKVLAFEIGYRAQWYKHFSTDITAFSNHYTDLIMFRRGAFDPATFTLPLHWFNSEQEVTTRGIEISADWAPLDWMRLTGYYTHLKMERQYDVNNPDIAGLSPRHRASLRWQIDVADHAKLDFTLRHVSKLSAVTQSVPAYTTFDARLAFQPVSGLELSVTAQNLFSPTHLEYRDSSSISLPATSLEVPRSIYGKISWEF
ncbi:MULTISPECIES: TonB-dependent receptor plug domain-containing protein [Methylomonas]|uniref:TonB-dependent receptor plug domain-containing protein n=1 Tax=Methylomonas TaxID=416 RepID=UPI001231EA73|nr:TonB-dependent receptor [Methylomonas rhizoryzae]